MANISDMKKCAAAACLLTSWRQYTFSDEMQQQQLSHYSSFDASTWLNVRRSCDEIVVTAVNRAGSVGHAAVTSYVSLQNRPKTKLRHLPRRRWSDHGCGNRLKLWWISLKLAGELLNISLMSLKSSDTISYPFLPHNAL